VEHGKEHIKDAQRQDENPGQDDDPLHIPLK
jgi:hypothetical protein